MPPRDEEAARLVGEPVGVSATGEHGVEFVAEPGKGTGFFGPHSCGIISGFLCLCIQWPFSFPMWLLILVGQGCAPCCYSCLGEAWCFNPSQIPYIHSLYVVWQTLKNTWFGYLCCCGWFIQLQPGVLAATVLLATPPLFIFDEDENTAVLYSFKDYIEKKKATFPPFSGKYRAVDGGGNNARYTFLGQGMRGYGMNEPFTLPSVLPNADEMQRALQLRTTFKGSPFGQNALSTWFANVAIHDFFRTATGVDNKYVGGVDKPWVNLHSSYLDIQPLYGWNAELADQVRSKVGGKLKAVAETRFDNSRVPESSAIVELLRREHNYVCDELATRYPQEFDTDEKLYQQARLIMGGVYINIILRQYGDQMFGENAPDGRGFIELRQRYGCWPSFGHNQTAGNHLTFNFNLIYRWHTGIPAEWSGANPAPMRNDDDIRKIITDSLNWEAGGFGPNNMPEDLFQRQISVPAVAVMQGRQVGAPRLNDFRRRFFAPYRDFLDMCGDPEVAAQVAHFYPSIEDVELSVGCQVEKTMPGGWCLGQTVGMAIVADAFNSIRQDRFYTEDFNASVYTEWGFNHAKTTILADLVNRHLQMGVDRNSMIGRIPGWKGPPEWSQMQGSPCPAALVAYDARGFPRLKQ
mmetsp:Transcript_76304/g.210612  ORF Transcript_76304/g.210612 Transcript_76304/m.210612 type:complete len:634 (+) Transcript_76304:2-1903(+)